MTDTLTIDESKLTTGAQSPFLPGTNIQFAWDSTSLGMLKTCPRLYQYTMIDGYTTRDESVHLRFGIEYHTAIEHFHKDRAAGIKREQAIRNAVRGILVRTEKWEVDETTPAGKYKNRNNLVALLIDYLDHIKTDAAKTYIREDGQAAVELSFRFELDWGPKATQPSLMEALEKGHHDKEVELGRPLNENEGFTANLLPKPYLLCGHLDAVVNFADNLYVLDHKTSKTTLSDYYFDQYTPSNQMTLYALAGKIVINSPIKGVIIDAAQIKLEEPNAFKRGFANRTPELLEEWTNDLTYWLNQAEAYATAGYWPMNDMACGMYGGCKFRGVCSRSPSTRKVYLGSDFIKQEPEMRWNPLRSRE